MLASEQRGGVTSRENRAAGKPFFDDNVSESDTPSTHDGDESAMSDLTDDCKDGLKLWDDGQVDRSAVVINSPSQPWEGGQFPSLAPFHHSGSAHSFDGSGLDVRFDGAVRVNHSATHRRQLELGERERRREEHSQTLIRERDSTAHRTLTTKKERRAAFDSLMDRRGIRNSTSWPRRHSSAPTSPVTPRLGGDGCFVTDFRLQDGPDFNAPDCPMRPSSAPVSPMVRSMRQPGNVSPLPMLVGALQVLDEPSAPVSTLVMETPQTPKVPKAVASVSFGNVDVRSYEVILGDNPSCVSGPSLSLGWRYNYRNKHVPVDDYEAEQAEIRSRFVPLLSRRYREEFLLHLGYSKSEMACAVREANKIKNRRRQTITNLYAARAEEVAEGTKRWVKRALQFGDKKKTKSTIAKVAGK